MITSQYIYIYDVVYISKVFTDTYVDEEILKLPNVRYGGTGFFYDKAPPLLPEIEHSMPDYHLYDEWLETRLNDKNKSEFKYYTDYSIGFLTRGCFRKCQFCVNQNYNHVFAHSPISEFYDPSRKKICLLDDNFLGYPKWKELLSELQELNKPFQFKQGLDERILTDEKCEMLFKSRYDGEFIFAFDNIADKDLITKKLQLIRKYTDKRIKFYVFCGFDRNDKWDYEFWKQDLFDLFERIRILMQYKCLPYVMRFNRYEESPYRGIYITAAQWCNQPQFFKKFTFREFVAKRKQSGSPASERYFNEVINDIPELQQYFDIKISA